MQDLQAENKRMAARIEELEAKLDGEVAAYQRGYLDGVPKGRASLMAEYPLERDLYDSKDWRCGSYSERVEWLHSMYEGAKEEIERLEQSQVDQEPVAWQRRTKLVGDGHWTDWTPCSKAIAKDCWRVPVLHGWQWEARALYAGPTQPRGKPLTDARWDYINKRAIQMSTAKYKVLCDLLHVEVDEESFELGEAIDRKIASHGI